MSPVNRSGRKTEKKATTEIIPAKTEPYRSRADHPEKNVHQIRRANSPAGQTNKIDILK
jgi:hypothetical protein